MPLFAAGSFEHSYVFGYVFFRRRRDESQSRGYFQQSVIVVTPSPFANLFKHVAGVVGNAFFDLGPTLLHAAHENLSAWPAPDQGALLELPLIGEILRFRVPRIGLHAYGAAMRRGGGPSSFEQTSSRHEMPTGSSAEEGAIEAAAAGGAGGAGGADSGTASRDAVKVGAAGAGGDATADGGGTGSDGTGGETSTPSPTGSTPIDADDVVLTEEGHPGTDAERVELTSDSVKADDAPKYSSVVTPVLAPVSPSVEDASLGEVLAGDQWEVAGLFQELGLFSCFQAHIGHLWKLWELVITGQPLLVFAATPQECGDAVLAAVSLIAPISYGGDFRPYFTIYDGDFREIADAHDASKGVKLPSGIIGVTNPIFLKVFRHWPNLLVYSTKAAEGLSLAAPLFRRSVSTPTRRIEVMKRSSDLESVVAAHEDPSKLTATPRFLVEKASLLPADPSVLSQLLPVPRDTTEAQLRLHANEGVSFGGGETAGDVPAVVINNSLLRQHFRQLTREFLRPFERYFTINRSAKTASLGPYDDMSAQDLVLQFDVERFLKHLASRRPPKAFRSSKWRRLYRGFVNSPHFQPWFVARQQEARDQVWQISRSLRLSSTVASLLHNVGVAVVDGTAVDAGPGASVAGGGGDLTARSHRSSRSWDLPDGRIRALHAQIWRAIRREAAQLAGDEELRSAMMAHLEGIEALVPSLRLQEARA